MSTDRYAEAVPAVAPERAEELWRVFGALAASHRGRAERAPATQREHWRRAQGYRAQIPPRRLAELEAQRLARTGEGR